MFIIFFCFLKPFVVLFIFIFSRVGIQLPTIEVRYENLSVDAEVHVGNRGLPTVLNSAMNTLEVDTSNSKLKFIKNRMNLDLFLFRRQFYLTL
jgi:ABC-transporter N-terminal